MSKKEEDRRIEIQPSPNRGSVFCCAIRQKEKRYAGISVENPCVGWVVYHDGKKVSGTFHTLHGAKRWAEERYQIGGWTPTPNKGPYRQTYAIPK